MLAVPLAAAQRVRQQLVGLLDGQEALLVAARAIGMEALGEASMGGLDLVQVGATQDAQDAVRIVAWPEGGHRASSCRWPQASSPSGASSKRGTAVAASRRSGVWTTGLVERRQRPQVALVEDADLRQGLDAGGLDGAAREVAVLDLDGQARRAGAPGSPDRRHEADGAQPVGARLGHEPPGRRA